MADLDNLRSELAGLGALLARPSLWTPIEGVPSDRQRFEAHRATLAKEIRESETESKTSVILGYWATFTGEGEGVVELVHTALTPVALGELIPPGTVFGEPCDWEITVTRRPSLLPAAPESK